MKKTFYIFALFSTLLLSSFSVRTSMAQLGVSVGINYSQLSDIDIGSGTSSFENSQGWHAEVWFDLPVGSLALRPGIRYTSAGNIFEFADDANLNFIDNFDVNMIEFPVDLRFRFAMQLTTPFIAVGPVFRFPSASGDDVNGLKTVNVAGGIGVGVELQFGPVELIPELKYTFGVTRFLSQEFQVNNIQFLAEERQHLNGVMLRLGIGF